MNNILEIKNLSKTYHTIEGEVFAIDNISFNLQDGEFISIVGSSGCGKSTILSILSNLDNDYEGCIITNNKKIGYMLQNDCLLPWLTIKENALLGLKLTHQLNDKTEKKVDKLLAKYNLKEFSNKYPKNLSGGMKQRVG